MFEENIQSYFHNISMKIRKIVHRELASLQISHPEMRILLIVYEREVLSQEELSALMEIDRSNVGRALKKLENGGFIKRERDPKDARTFQIFLTTKGRSARDQIVEIKRNLRKTFIIDGSADELEIFLKYLKKIDDNLTEENYYQVKNADN